METRRTRVLVDTFHLYNALTGIRSYTTQLCEGLESANDLSAEYIIYPDWRKLDRSVFLKGKLNPAKKVLNHLSMAVWKQIVLPFLIRRWKIDVVYCPDFVAPYFRNRAVAMPVIHDTFFWDFKANYPYLWRIYYLGMIEKGLRDRTVIIATSEYTAKNIKRIFHADLPVEVVYQSPKLRSIIDADKAILQKYGLRKTSYFLHVGLFDRRKNIQLLVKAFAKLLSDTDKDFKLVLVGEKGLGKNHDDFKAVKQLIRERNLEKKVVLTGFVSNEELESLYTYALAYVFPSLDEGFGIPVLEAMNYDIPLIISDRGSLREIAGRGALVFDATNENDLAEKMHEIQNPKLREDLIRQGRSRVKKFSKKHFVKQVDELIKKYSS